MMIINTRPENSGEELNKLLIKENFSFLHIPLISIKNGRDIDLIEQKLNQLPDNAFVILASKNAVHTIPKSYKPKKSLQFFAIGRSTAQTFYEYFNILPFYPKIEETSEELLKLPKLQQIKNKNILILKGFGGRKLIMKTLKKRAAKLDYCECYQREFTKINSNKWIAEWKVEKRNIIVTTSCETLYRFYDLIPEEIKGFVLKSELIVVSKRAENLAKKLGWINITVSPFANNFELIKTIKQLTNQEPLQS